MTIQRYALLTGAIVPTVSGGDWVKHEDYEALLAEARRLREEIKRQAAAAHMGMDAAKRASTIQLQLAEQARAESSPEVIASERAMNALLTEENEALREDAERWRTEMRLRNNPRVAIMFVGIESRCLIHRGGILIASGDTYADAIDAARAEVKA
ncbi:hypothetical protein [Pararobbsia alpina]|uniref:Uncharacterized protein n=1 Tax=Pararobbsia alpina TaxID=621374 RepID=A0A6S7CP68_9BURK|nr:hypothetical protein [Pararobbsia alpina]CAB3784426.1 hypothetical protein LMG28138_01807 [Pararobbsia alpina]